ncbi:MAG: aldehyde dehydrogenase family protein [Pirellulales bacterium]|nr:aldehyde dehydrogenase family protein [Pirellulales bacterium]
MPTCSQQSVSGVVRNWKSKVALDGRMDPGDRFLLGPCVVDHVQPQMRIACEEIFGPVLFVIRVLNLQSALEIGRGCPYGNGEPLFTSDGYAA